MFWISRYLSGVYKLSLGLTLQISKLVYGEDKSFEHEKYRIEKNETIEGLTIVVDKILNRKLNILINPDNIN